MKPGFKQLLLCSALAAIVAPIASAQDNPFLRGRYTSVVERPQPEFDPLPIRAGTFDVTASLGGAVELNDNIFATPTNTEEDTIVRVKPEIYAQSTWSVHELAAGLTVDHREYSSNDSETATDYNATLTGRIDVTRDFQVRLGGSAGHVTEPRYFAASSGAGEPSAYDNTGFFATAQFRSDRLQFSATAGVAEQSFDQQAQRILRDNTSTYLDGRVSYAVSPDVAVFVQARQADLDYSDTDRDGSLTTVDAGVNFELAAPFRGEIAVGSFKDAKDSPLLEETSGLNVRANVEWFPTDLTNVTFSAYRGVFDPGLATSASAVSTTFGVRVDHELMRNLRLFGTLRNEVSEYQGTLIDREDDAIAGSIGALYKVNRNMRLELEFSTRNQESSGANAGPDLDQNVISAGIRFFP